MSLHKGLTGSPAYRHRLLTSQPQTKVVVILSSWGADRSRRWLYHPHVRGTAEHWWHLCHTKVKRRLLPIEVLWKSRKQIAVLCDCALWDLVRNTGGRPIPCMPGNRALGLQMAQELKKPDKSIQVTALHWLLECDYTLTFFWWALLNDNLLLSAPLFQPVSAPLGASEAIVKWCC